ncbi:MAG: hypothetical protein K2Q33_05360 [Gammaproteobacteria bacterium]|nr:hypothetical protein [Gammaproteobacteria bacterium]
MRTQISLILLGLGLACGSAYAGTVSEPLPVSNDVNVTLPNQSGMWSFGATAVLMQPVNKAFSYADISTLTTDQINNGYVYTDTKHETIDQAYHWWFGADVTYAFPGSGRDVTLAYEGLHGTDTDHVAGDPPPQATGTPPVRNFPFNSPIVTSAFTGEPYTEAKGKVETNYDAGDLTFGQKIDMGQRVRLHPFIGLRYAYINTKDTGYYTGGTANPTVLGAYPTAYSSIENGVLENTFNGIGPRFGSDAQINLGQGFSIRGRLGLSALIGSRSIENSASPTEVFYDASGAQVGVIEQTNKSDSDTHVIPEIDGRLGLNYTHNLNANLALGVEAGWQATNYFNVIAEPYNSGPLSSSDDHDVYSDSSNFGLQGPYARVQLDIA